MDNNLEEHMKKRPRNQHDAAAAAAASRVDPTSAVPDDCLRHVFSFLPTTRDRTACSAVSRRWFNLQLQIVRSKVAISDQETTPREASRKIAGPSFSDLSLAAMLVGINSDEVLTSVSIVRECLPCQSNGSHVTDAGIDMLSRVCTRLRSVSLHNCTKIGNASIARIAYNCGSLQRIELTNSWLVTDEGVTLLAMKCTGLSVMKLDTCYHISDRSLEAIARYSARLKSLELAKLPLVEGRGVASILFNRLHLETIKIETVELSDNVLCSSPQKWSPTTLKNVSVINPGRDLTGKGLRLLTKLAPMIEDLYLEGIEFAIPFCGLLQILANCRRAIKSLELVQCATCESKTSLPGFDPGNKIKFSRLQRLTLRECSNITDESLHVLGRSCRSIREVTLVGLDSITNRGIITFMRNLHHVNKVYKIVITGCARIGNSSVWAITRTCGSKLTSLVITNCELVTDHGVGTIGTRCPRLTNLDLSGTGIGDAGVRKIVSADLFHLEALSLRQCGRISDASITAIANAPFLISLEQLGLSGCAGLSKAGLEMLESLAYELI